MKPSWHSGRRRTGRPVRRAHVPGDPVGLTDVPGVWVAGNVTDPMAQVITAAAQGARTGAMLNADLVEEDTTAAESAA